MSDIHTTFCIFIIGFLLNILYVFKIKLNVQSIALLQEKCINVDFDFLKVDSVLLLFKSRASSETWFVWVIVTVYLRYLLGLNCFKCENRIIHLVV